MDDLVDMGNLNPLGEIEPINAQGGQEGQNRQTIHGQSGNNNIVYMECGQNGSYNSMLVLFEPGVQESNSGCHR